MNEHVPLLFEALQARDTKLLKRLLCIHHVTSIFDINATFGEKQNSLIHHACDTHFTDALRIILQFKKKELQLNQENADGFTALQLACIHGNLQAVIILYNAGASLDYESEKLKKNALDIAIESNGHVINNNTATATSSQSATTNTTNAVSTSPIPLPSATNITINNNNSTIVCLNQHSEIIQFLMASSSTLKAKTTQLLLQTIKNGNTPAAIAMIEGGAAINEEDKVDKKFPLYCAVELGQTDVVRALLRRGALATSKYKKVEIVDFAVEKNFPEIVEILLCSGASFNSALYKAVKMGFAHVVKICLDLGANVQEPNEVKKILPLHAAAAWNRPEIVPLLLNAGADVNMVSEKTKFTSLHFATKNNSVDVVKMLIQHGANVNATNDHGDIPLHWASSNNNVEIVSLLVEAKSNVNAKASSGAHPLTLAAAKGGISIATILLEAGSDLEATNGKGDSPLTVASEVGHFDMVKLFVSRGANIRHANNEGFTAILNAAYCGNLEMFKYLESHGADVNTITNNGATCIMMAAKKSRIEIMRYLLEEKRINVNQKNVKGSNALTFAIPECTLETVKLLVDAGIDVNNSNEFGFSPLFLAAGWGQRASLEYLLEKTKPDIHFKCHKDFSTPILNAANYGHADIVKMLLKHGASINDVTKEGKTVVHLLIDKKAADCVQFSLDYGIRNEKLHYQNTRRADSKVLKVLSSCITANVKLLRQHKYSEDSSYQFLIQNMGNLINSLHHTIKIPYAAILEIQDEQNQQFYLTGIPVNNVSPNASSNNNVVPNATAASSSTMPVASTTSSGGQSSHNNTSTGNNSLASCKFFKLTPQSPLVANSVQVVVRIILPPPFVSASAFYSASSPSSNNGVSGGSAFHNEMIRRARFCDAVIYSAEQAAMRHHELKDLQWFSLPANYVPMYLTDVTTPQKDKKDANCIIA